MKIQHLYPAHFCGIFTHIAVFAVFSCGGNHLALAQKRLIAIPLVKIEQHISADYQIEHSIVGVLSFKFTDSVYRVACTAHALFNITYLKLAACYFVCKGKFAHLSPVLKSDKPLVALVRRYAGRYYQHFLKFKVGESLFHHIYMSVVNGVESTAEYAYLNHLILSSFS